MAGRQTKLTSNLLSKRTRICNTLSRLPNLLFPNSFGCSQRACSQRSLWFRAPMWPRFFGVLARGWQLVSCELHLCKCSQHPSLAPTDIGRAIDASILKSHVCKTAIVVLHSSQHPGQDTGNNFLALHGLHFAHDGGT